MKTLQTLKLLLVVSLLLNGLKMMAGTGPVTGTATAKAEKTIQDYFRFPKVLMPKAEEKVKENLVEVVFTTTAAGKVNFVLAKTEDQILKKEIERQFSNLILPQLKQDVVHSVTLKFKTV